MATDPQAQAFGLLAQADTLLRRVEKLVVADSEQYLAVGDALSAISNAMGISPSCHTGEVLDSIGCAICLNIDNSRKTPATAVANGYSVCEAHVALASNPNFDILRIKGAKK